MDRSQRLRQQWIARWMLVVGIVLSLVPGLPILAAPPDIDTTPIDIAFPFEGCPFLVEYRFTGTLKTSIHRDQDENERMKIERFIHGQSSFTNLTTGTSVRAVSAGPNRFVTEKDGSTSIIFTGQIGSVTVPGEGVVFQMAGRFVVDAVTGEVLFDAGQLSLLTGDIQGLCAALT